MVIPAWASENIFEPVKKFRYETLKNVCSKINFDPSLGSVGILPFLSMQRMAENVYVKNDAYWNQPQLLYAKIDEEKSNKFWIKPAL